MTEMEKYLIENYLEEIAELMNEPKERSHVSLNVDLAKLQQNNFDWFQAILINVQSELPKWKAALFAAQKTMISKDDAFLDIDYSIKVNCHVRFVHMPAADPRYKIPFPNADQIGQFRELTGNVVRMTVKKLLELKREFICSKCKELIIVDAEYGLLNRFEVPRHCSSYSCPGTVRQKSSDPEPKYCINYQEIKIQEALSDKNIPPTVTITLENDLVDSCQPGDCVTVCGTIERRWITFQSDKPCRAMISVRAVSLTREQNHFSLNRTHMSEQLVMMQMEWTENLDKYGELGIRDLVLKSICSDIYGMYPIKLALALAICSGNDTDFDSKAAGKLHDRGQSHVLLIGDPGLAKSKLLLSAASIAPRAVHTTGMGCSSAGLTAAAVKEGGEWQLEAGALVLADGGVCCIDEFNLMRETDRASIHEAMEQQTISMAKAGIVCKLNTRCSIIAAANPKNLYSMSEPEGPSSINIGIASPLLSRFDLVFILRDERIPEWDSEIADHLLAQVCADFQGVTIKNNPDLWSTQKLQTHFASICNVQPKMTDMAKEIIGAYYRQCRTDPKRDNSRTTVRLLDSLHRLAVAHARLLFRAHVTVLDAIVVIRLMESTYGFGRIVKPYDVIKEDLPLGPDNNEINEIFKIFQLGEYDSSTNSIDNNNSSEPIPSQKRSYSTTSQQATTQPVSGDTNSKREANKTPGIKSVENKTFQKQWTGSKLFESQPAGFKSSETEASGSKSFRSQPIEFNCPEISSLRVLKTSFAARKAIESTSVLVDPPTPAYDDDELDRILSLDESPTQTPMEVCNDDEDIVLLQALDNVEQSQRAPLLKIRKITEKPPNRLYIGSRECGFQQSKMSDENTSPIEKSTKALKKCVRNRLFCTPSEDESTQPPATLTQINEPEIPKSPAKEDDSAYDTMASSLQSFSSMIFEMKPDAKTGKTPPIFSGDTSEPQDDEDLSFLDNLEF